MPRMNLRGLCVCSFGLRTIAVLMSLFPSLGISSFHTAVCCDGENEYTTHAPACQLLFAFFLDFFAFFCGRGFFLLPGGVTYTRPFESLRDRTSGARWRLRCGGRDRNAGFYRFWVGARNDGFWLLQIPGSSPRMTLLLSPG